MINNQIFKLITVFSFPIVLVANIYLHRSTYILYTQFLSCFSGSHDKPSVCEPFITWSIRFLSSNIILIDRVSMMYSCPITMSHVTSNITFVYVTLMMIVILASTWMYLRRNYVSTTGSSTLTQHSVVFIVLLSLFIHVIISIAARFYIENESKEYSCMTENSVRSARGKESITEEKFYVRLWDHQKISQVYYHDLVSSVHTHANILHAGPDSDYVNFSEAHELLKREISAHRHIIVFIFCNVLTLFYVGLMMFQNIFYRYDAESVWAKQRRFALNRALPLIWTLFIMKNMNNSGFIDTFGINKLISAFRK